MFLHWSGGNVVIELDYYLEGTPGFSSTVKKFGTHSLELAGTNTENGVYYIPTASLPLGNYWTIEGWFYAVDPGAGKYGTCDVFTVETDQNNEFGITADFNAGEVNWFWKVSTAASTDDEPNTAYATWRHIALVRNGNQWLTYFDGTQGNDPAGDSEWLTGDINRIVVGFTNDGAGGGFNGYIDELRISTVARYTSLTSISVPTAAFTPDDDTLFLRHYDNSYT